MAKAVFSAVFLLILYLAKVSINDLGAANGLNDVIQQNFQGEPIHLTSVKPVDGILTMVVRFFQPIVAATDLPLTLFSVFMAGQLLAVHVLIVIEGMRAGNRGKAISYTAAWGMLWQLITFGVTLPIYFLVWIWTSPIPDASSAKDFAAAISVDPLEGHTIMGAWTIGALVPTVVAGLPSPGIVSSRTQEISLAIWQAFPLWTALLQAPLVQIAKMLDLVPDAIRWKPETKIDRFQKIYTYALTLTTVTCIGTLGYVYASGGAEPLDLLREIFLPTWPWDTKRMASLEKGILAFLQWDTYCASLATWSWIAYNSYAKGGVGQVVIDLGKAVAWTAVVGPGGAALAVVWGRDIDAIRAGAREEKKGKKRV